MIAPAINPDHPPLISVVLPVFNAARYLPMALASITAQTMEDFEIIAINDGSTDGSLAILEQHAALDPRLRVLSRPNTGIIGALNDGLAAARGAFVARMDADDDAHPERFARQLARLHAEPQLVALGTAVVFMDAASRSVQACPRPLTHAEIELRLLAGDGGALIHPTLMARTAALRTVGGYRLLRPGAQYFEDLDLYLRLAQVGTLANLIEPLLRYRVHAASINFTPHPERRSIKIQILAEAYAARGRSFNALAVPDDTHGDPLRHAREWAASSLAYGSRRVAVSYGWRAVCLHPQSLASWRALHYALTAPVRTPQ